MEERVYVVSSVALDYDDYPIGSNTVHFLGTDRDLAVEVVEKVVESKNRTRLDHLKITVDCYVNNVVDEEFPAFAYPKKDYEQSGYISRGMRGGILRVDKTD